MIKLAKIKSNLNIGNIIFLQGEEVYVLNRDLYNRTYTVQDPDNPHRIATGVSGKSLEFKRFAYV